MALNQEQILALLVQAKDDASATLSKINAAVVQMGVDGEKANQKLKKSQEDFRNNLKQTSTQLGIFGGAVVGAFGLAIKGALDYGESMRAMAKTTGSSVEEFSRLAYAVEQEEGSVEGLQQGLFFLNKNLFAASQGSKQANDAFQSLGLSATDSNGKIKDSTTILLELAQGFENGTIKGKQLEGGLMAIAGKGAKDLIPFLKSGSTNIKALMEEAEKLGIVLDDKTAGAFDKVNDSLKSFQLGLRGLIINFLKEFMPVIDMISTGMKKFVIFLNGLSPSMKSLLIVVPLIAGAFSLLAATVGGAILAMSAALGTFLLPVIAIGAVLGVLVVAWKNNWGGMRDTTLRVIAVISSAFSGFWNTLKPIFIQLFNSIVSIGNVFKTSGEKSIDFGIILYRLLNIVRAVADVVIWFASVTILGFAGAIKSAGLFADVLGKVLAKDWKGAKTAAGDYLNNFRTTFAEIVSVTDKAGKDIETSLGNAFSDTADIEKKLTPPIREAEKAVVDLGKAGGDSLNVIAEGSKEAAENIDKAIKKIKEMAAGIGAMKAEAMTGDVTKDLEAQTKIYEDIKKTIEAIVKLSGQAGISGAQKEALTNLKTMLAAELKIAEATKIRLELENKFHESMKATGEEFKDLWANNFKDIGSFMDGFFKKIRRQILDEMFPEKELTKKFGDIGNQFKNLFSGKGFDFGAALGGIKLPSINLGGLGDIVGNIAKPIGDMLGAVGAAFGPIGSIVGAALGPIADMIGGLFASTPNYGRIALENMAKTIQKIEKLWNNAVDSLDRALNKSEKGESTWDTLFANTLEERKRIEDEINALGEDELAKKASLQAQLAALEQKKIDLSVLGIQGLSGFATYEEGLKQILLNHMNLVAGSNEAELDGLNEKRKIFELLKKYSETQAQIKEIQSMGPAGDWSKMGALQETLQSLGQQYAGLTNEQIPSLENLSQALSDASGTYTEALNAYGAGTISQDELISMIDDMKKYQEATGASQEDIIALMGPQIQALQDSGKLTALQAEALRQSIGMSQGVRDALKAQELETLANTTVTGDSVEAVKKQLVAMGLDLNAKGDIVDAEGNVYGSVTSLDGKVTSLTTISSLLKTAQERAAQATTDLIGANNKLKDAIVELKNKITGLPGAATGGSVARSGMAVIHAGEYILTKQNFDDLKAGGILSGSPASGNNSTQNFGYGGNTVTVEVNINGGVMTGDAESVRRFYRDNLKQYIAEDVSRYIK